MFKKCIVSKKVTILFVDVKYLSYLCNVKTKDISNFWFLFVEIIGMPQMFFQYIRQIS